MEDWKYRGIHRSEKYGKAVWRVKLEQSGRMLLSPLFGTHVAAQVWLDDNYANEAAWRPVPRSWHAIGRDILSCWEDGDIMAETERGTEVLDRLADKVDP